MKTFLIVKSLLICVALAATTTYAVIYEGSFNGVVRSFENGDNDINLTGYWEDVSEGSPVSGSFWYDTDIAPGNTSDFTTSSFYQSYTDEWMRSNFTVDGKTYHVSNLPLFNHSTTKSEGVWLRNFQPEIDSSTAEVFYLFDNISTGDYAGSRSAGLTVEVSSGLTPMLDGLDLAQTFDWYDVSDPNSFAQAHLQLSAVTDDERKASSAWVDISEFHLDLKDLTKVPGPSPIILVCIGVVALLLKSFVAKSYT